MSYHDNGEPKALLGKGVELLIFVCHGSIMAMTSDFALVQVVVGNNIPREPQKDLSNLTCV